MLGYAVMLQQQITQYYKYQVVQDDRFIYRKYQKTMNHQQPQPPSKLTHTQLSQHLITLIKQHTPGASIKNLLDIFIKIDMTKTQQRTLIEIIDELCDEVLKLKTQSVILVNINKDQQIQNVLKKYLAYPHHQDIYDCGQSLSVLVKYRAVITQYFHFLVHHTTLKSITKLCVLFYKLVSLQMLQVRIFNYFLLHLILTHQNLVTNRDIRIIKACLRSLQEKNIISITVNIQQTPTSPTGPQATTPKPPSNPCYPSSQFTILSYLIFFSNGYHHKTNEQYTKTDKILVQKLIQNPIKLIKIILTFRNEFPQESVLSCQRNLYTLGQCIIDNFLLKALLRIFLDYQLNKDSRDKLYFVVGVLVRFNLTVHTVKSMIKMLEIVDTADLQNKWRNMFLLLKTALPAYSRANKHENKIEMLQSQQDSPKKVVEQLSWQKIQKAESSPSNASKKAIVNTAKDILKFKKANSYMKFNLEHEFNGFYFEFSSYRTHQEFLLLKLRNGSHEIWIMVRHIEEHHFQLSGIRLHDKNPIQMNKVQIQWNPFQKHAIQAIVQDDQIMIKILESSNEQERLLEQGQNKWVTFLNIKNIRPKQIILGTNDSQISCYATQVSCLNIYYCQGKNSLNLILHNRTKLKQNSREVKYISKPSLIQILKKLGDIDLFFLIASHIIRKVENDQDLSLMLKEVINFLEELVLAKGVFGVKLSEKDKQKRFYNVRCLVWLASKHKRNPQAILQIFRLLSIRGVKRPLECLEILSNIGLWKQLPEKPHSKLIDRIKQTCGQISVSSSNQITQIMKKIMLDFMIFYKNNQLLSENLQNQHLLKHSQILKLIYDVLTAQNYLIIIGFVQFLLKILYILLDRTKNSDYIDTSLGFQVALLAYRLVKFARQVHFLPDKQKVLGDVKKAIKMTKTGLMASRSINMPILSSQAHYDRDEQLVVLKLQQALAWANQIYYCLNNQLLHPEESIKFYDWQWDEKSSMSMSSIFSIQRKGIQSQKKLRKVCEGQILKLCQKIQVGMMSFDKNIFNVLNISDLSQNKWEIFWEMNLFDKKISTERFINTIEFGHFDKIIWDDSKIKQVLQRSFDLAQNGIAVKLPEKLLESMKPKDIDSIHNCLLGIYLQKCQDKNPVQRQKCAQKIMYISAIIPGSLYTNTQLLREQLLKQKRNIKIIELVQKHLILKQLANQGFKLMKQIKHHDASQLNSTINAFDDGVSNASSKLEDIKLNISQETQELDSKKSNPRKNSQEINTFYVLENVQFQQSFYQMPESIVPQTITTQKIKESLEHIRLLASPSEIQAFYRISSQNKQDVNEQIAGHITNYNLNIDAIIKILDEQSQQGKSTKISQLQNYLFFIEKQLYGLSKRILSEYLFTSIKKIKVGDDTIRSKRKKSFKSANNYKFKEISEKMLDEFLKDRRGSVFKMEIFWVNVEKNNKDFWQIFFKSEKKNQSVDLVCNALKLRGLIKVDHEKRQIELPKNMTTISNKFSISGDSDRDDPNGSTNQSTIFDDAAMYQQQELSESDKQQNSKPGIHLNEKFMIDEILKHKKKKRSNQFAVLYITTTTIYQGVIICQPHSIKFIEDLIPDSNFYDLICANENQQRTPFQIQKRKQEFEIFLNEKSTIIPKKYLYYDAAVEVYSQKNTSFFVFRKSSRREHFLKRYQQLKGTIINENQLINTVHKQTVRWINGDISNFTYLMHLNDLSGRTFNDMSQYYIFPWILINYKSQKFNKKFIKNEANYRDLSKPIGGLNPKRFEQLLTRFKESTKYQQTQSYLYGSYCSNPAIVCNFLVRLQPFSMHHYLLQSKQFDLADRIFYSVSNQFNACYTNIGDYKQLIPQFYSCPQFLRNRNKYKFGEKQNKEVVNNVELPEWAHYQFGERKNRTSDLKLQSVLPQQQFIFRMRKCLESEIVTKNLNFWIDLIFGPYNRKDKAMERYNLYISHIYKNQTKKQSKDTMLIFYKQFGQMPRDIFEREHKVYKGNRTYYKLGNSQLQIVSDLSSKSYKKKKYYANNKFFICWDEITINIIDIKNKSGLIEKTENNTTQVPLKSEDIQQLKILTVEDGHEESKKTDFLIYLKQGKLMLREMSISTFRKKLEVKDQKQSFFPVETRYNLMEIYEQQKLVVLVVSSSIKIYQYSFHANSLQKSGEIPLSLSRMQVASDQILKYSISKKQQLKFHQIFEFTQHKSEIEHIGICQSYGLLISIDSNRKVYTLKINSKQIEVIQYFRLKKLANCENIIQMEVHQMGFIMVLTSLNFVHVYNLMGDYVAMFAGNTLRQISKKMYKKMQSSIQFDKNLYELKIGHEKNQQNVRKKSDNDMPTQRMISCQFEQSDPDTFNPSIVVTENENYPSSITAETERKTQIVEQINCFKIWNHQSGQLIFGTNLGNVYRLDLFMFEDCENVDFSRTVGRKMQKIGKSGCKPIQFMSVNRIGRHWQCWVASEQDLFKIQSQDYRNADKRNQEYRKKCVIE